MTLPAFSDRPASQHRQQDPQQLRMAASGWNRVARPRLAWWLCAGSLLLMAVGLVLLVLSRHARFPPSMDPWDEQALVILKFLGAPILGGLIAARRPSNLYGWLWCVIGLGVGLDAFARGYATYGLFARPAPCRAPWWPPGRPTSPGSSAWACSRWCCCCSPTAAFPPPAGGRWPG
jgi:hypothetical protein